MISFKVYIIFRFDEAIEYYEEIPSIYWNYEIEYNLANCHHIQEKFEEAIKQYNNISNLNKEKPNCLCNLGKAYYVKLSLENALKCFWWSFDLDSNNSSVI